MLHDLLRDTDIYQLIVQEGLEKGIQVGEEKGMQKARQEELQRQLEMLLHFVQARFPKLVRFATKQLSGVTDRERLDDLIYKIGLSQLTEEEARQLFIDLDIEEKS